MAMPLENLHALPRLLPIPEFNRHIVTCGQAEWLGRVNRNRTDIVRVGLEARYLLGRIVVDNAQLEIIRPGNDPVLAGHEATSSYWDIGEFKCLDGGACFVGPDVDVPAVERREDPWFYFIDCRSQSPAHFCIFPSLEFFEFGEEFTGRVEINALNSLGASKELPL